MKLKKEKNNKNLNLNIRLSLEEKNMMQTKANLYAEGDLSHYVRYACMNFVPDKTDFTDEIIKKAKTKKNG